MEATPASAPSAASPTKRSRPSAESDQEDGDYPYEVDATDHCETPGAAYDHVAPLLRMLAALSGRTPATLRIYDPYYCEGGVVGRLGELGFHRVYNEREDFYEVRPGCVCEVAAAGANGECCRRSSGTGSRCTMW